MNATVIWSAVNRKETPHEQANLPTKQHLPPPYPRLPGPDEHQEWPGGYQPSSGQGPTSSGGLTRVWRRGKVEMSLSLPKEALLTKSWQYQQVYRHGKRAGGKAAGITLVFRDNGQDRDRLGISVGGQSSSVRRNRIKRLLKEFYRLHRGLPSLVARRTPSSQGVDLVVATNQNFKPQGLADIQAAFCRITGLFAASGAMP